jgi:hypothetical protein
MTTVILDSDSGVGFDVAWVAASVGAFVVAGVVGPQPTTLVRTITVKTFHISFLKWNLMFICASRQSE